MFIINAMKKKKKANIIEEAKRKEKTKQKNMPNLFVCIPNDCLYEILLFLSMSDVMNIPLICSRLNDFYNRMPDNYWKIFAERYISKSFVQECAKILSKKYGWKEFFQNSYHSLLTKIIHGGNDTFFVREKTIYACGWNEKGQLGIGHGNNVSTPTKIELDFTENEVIENVIFDGNSTFIHTNKSVYVCGWNEKGQLGVGHKKDVSTPTKIELKNLAENEVIKNIISNHCSTFIYTNKSVYVCGWNEKGQLGVGHKKDVSTPTKIELKNLAENEVIENVIFDGNSTFIHTNKSVYVCGWNEKGQLGVGHKKDVSTPTKIELKNLAENEVIKNIISSIYSTFIYTNKSVYVCGWNEKGRLGVRHKNNVLTPTKMKLNLAKNEVIENVIFDGNSTFIHTNKSVYVCGENQYGQLGVGHKKDVSTPTKIELNFTENEVIENVIPSSLFSTFIQTNKSVYVCGWNKMGQLGVGHKNDVSTPTKMKLNLVENEVMKGVISNHCSTFIYTNKSIYVCGWNEKGQLGVGYKKDVSTPTKIELKNLAKNEAIKNVIFGEDSTFIQTNKSIYVCGWNEEGQLGVGHKSDVSAPTKMKLNFAKNEVIENVIFCDNFIFTRTNKSVYVCGENQYGQFGVGHKDNVLTPTKMELNLAENEVIKCVISSLFSTFIHTNSGIYACGRNGSGQLGIGLINDVVECPKRVKLLFFEKSEEKPLECEKFVSKGPIPYA